MSLRESILAALVAHYKLNDNAASTAVLNAAGLPNGTSIRNTSLMHADGKIGGASNFNGISDYIDTGQTFQTTFRSNFAINLWVKKPDEEDYNEVYALFGVMDSGVNNLLNVHICQDEGGLVCTYESGSIPSLTINTPLSPSNNWYMLTVIVEQSGENTILSVYKNGAFLVQDIKASAMSSYTSVVNLTIGARNSPDVPDCFFDGLLENFMIFNKALSAEEIAYLYNGGAGREEFTAARRRKFGRGWR